MPLHYHSLGPPRAKPQGPGVGAPGATFMSHTQLKLTRRLRRLRRSEALRAMVRETRLAIQNLAEETEIAALAVQTPVMATNRRMAGERPPDFQQ